MLLLEDEVPELEPFFPLGMEFLEIVTVAVAVAVLAAPAVVGASALLGVILSVGTYTSVLLYTYSELSTLEDFFFPVSSAAGKCNTPVAC